jgi:hypothetical protein
MDTDPRVALGLAYKRWMHQNGLSQQNPHDLAKAAQEAGLVPSGAPPYAPWNSQVSLFGNGRLDAKAGFFLSLGSFNAAIAAKQFPPNTTRQLKDKLLATKPFVDDDGKPVDAVGFFAMFIGQAPIPEAYASISRVYTEDDVPGVNEMCRTAFRKIAEDQLLGPREAWEKLKPLCTGMKAAQVDKFRSVLSGWDDWTLEEINALTLDGDALGLPAQALDRLGKGLMVPVQLRSQTELAAAHSVKG